MKAKCNCCDGIYNSFDVHFTSDCDNKCSHCVDLCYSGYGILKPDIQAITDTIIKNCSGIDDVLFLGGEPCLYLGELLDCVVQLKECTNLKLYITTAVPKICFDNYKVFYDLIDIVDGINLSVQHYNESVADKIRRTKSTYDRQHFYSILPQKHKIRININIVKPYLYTRHDISECLRHYDVMGFSSIKLSEIQHGSDVYVSFTDVFGIKLKSPYSYGCQTYLDMNKIIPGVNTPVLLKRSCFLCEDSLRASLNDGFKVACKILRPSKNKYGVIYENGNLEKGWV